MIHAIFRRFAALTLLTLTSAAYAQNYDLFVDRAEMTAVPIEQSDPIFPGSGFRTGQEGWVRVNFVVTPDGRTTDMIIVDSVGGGSFEEAAREAAARWTFESGEVEIPFNVVDIRFELYRGRDAATSNFLRRYRRIMTHILEEEANDARQQVDQAIRLGGWNLYEEVMLALMVGRVEGLEGDVAEKLEHYQRALMLANRQALDGKDRRDALSRLFEMQHFYKQYGSALVTLALLQSEPRGASAAETLEPKAAEIRAALSNPAPINVQASLYNPCNCEEGQPLFHYKPVRSEFSFTNVDGNVERFEARCQASRLQGNVETGRRYVLPESPGQCEIFVFGADGAGFELVEHNESETVVGVATADVLDQRN